MPLPSGLSLELFHYWRSSSSWRVRLALDYLELPYRPTPVDLVNGESEGEAHRARHPQGYVPALRVIGDRDTPISSPYVLCESIAILEWLHERFGAPQGKPLLPATAFHRAYCRLLAETINAGTQPLQNPTVTQFYSTDPASQKRWNQHWIALGLQAYEQHLAHLEQAGSRGVDTSWSLGGITPTLADFTVIPQLYNARRFDVPIEPYARLQRLEQFAAAQSFVQSSHPDRFKPGAAT